MAAEVEDGCRLEDVQCFALRKAGDDVHEDDVGMASLGDSLSAGGADISRPDDTDFARYSATLQ